jgi:peptidyl-prolyl cis-trans isomerase SurA
MRVSLEAAAQRPPLFLLPAVALVVAMVVAMALATALAAPARAEVIDRVAAAVGGEAIPQSEVDETWAAVQATPAPGRPAPASRDEVLSRMVDVRVQLERAREAGLEARPEDVEQALTRIMADNGVHSLSELSAALEREGRTLEDLRRDVRDQITVLRLVQREVTSKLRVPTEQLRAYYDAHPEQFSTGRTVHVRQIVFVTAGLSDDEAAKAAKGLVALRSKVTGREAFRLAEKQLGDTPGVVTGDAGRLAEDELRPDLARILFSLEPGQVSPPVQLPNGVGIFLVDSRDPGTPKPFDEALPDVRQAVTQQESMARGAEWLARLKRGAYIEVKGEAPPEEAVPDTAPPADTPAPAPKPPARRAEPAPDDDGD